MARAVNDVWNYCNALSYEHTRRTGQFFSAYDLQHYTAGATKGEDGLPLNAASVQMIGAELVKSRKQCKKARLAWRVSNPNSNRRSLGWIPFRHDSIQHKNGQIHYCGTALSFWDSFGLAQYNLGSGCISEDSRGRWYLNITATLKVATPLQGRLFSTEVGIDLGLKSEMVLSDGARIEAPQFYRKAEAKLGIAQRAGKPKQVRNLHAKIKNQRKDHQHKFTTRIVTAYSLVAVGDLNVDKLNKKLSRMGKSFGDAGLSTLKTMLQYKGAYAGSKVLGTSEKYSTVTCGACFARTGPSGLKGLRIRDWTCGGCGITHDRDINAAQNILRFGHEALAVGIPSV